MIPYGLSELAGDRPLARDDRGEEGHGPIQVLNFSSFGADFPGTFRTATSIRNETAERGWNKVVAFQTRNPMHRAHEELCKMAMAAEKAGGILIHVLLGELKKSDIPGDVATPQRNGSAAAVAMGGTVSACREDSVSRR